MAKPAAATKIRNFLVQVDLSTLKSKFFQNFLDGRKEYIVESMFQKESGRNVDLNHLKKAQTNGGDEILNFFGPSRFDPLKIAFFFISLVGCKDYFAQFMLKINTRLTF